jgi:hypothetical protein
MTDAQTGREFMREAWDDPAQWAARFLAAYAASDAVRTDADRLEFVSQWFEDFAEAVRKAKPKPIVETPG